VAENNRGKEKFIKPAVEMEEGKELAANLRKVLIHYLLARSTRCHTRMLGDLPHIKRYANSLLLFIPAIQCANINVFPSVSMK